MDNALDAQFLQAWPLLQYIGYAQNAYCFVASSAWAVRTAAVASVHVREMTDAAAQAAAAAADSVSASGMVSAAAAARDKALRTAEATTAAAEASLVLAAAAEDRAAFAENVFTVLTVGYVLTLVLAVAWWCAPVIWRSWPLCLAIDRLLTAARYVMRRTRQDDETVRVRVDATGADLAAAQADLDSPHADADVARADINTGLTNMDAVHEVRQVKRNEERLQLIPNGRAA